MPLPTSFLAYSDCFDALEKAYADPIGGRIAMPSQEAAIHLQMRMNYARKLDRAKNAGIYEPDHPMHGNSLYDKLVTRIRPNGNRVYLYLLHRKALDLEPLTEVEVGIAEPPEPPARTPEPKLDLRPVPTLTFKRRV